MDSSGKRREREMRVTVLDNVVLGLSDTVTACHHDPPLQPHLQPQLAH